MSVQASFVGGKRGPIINSNAIFVHEGASGFSYCDSTDCSRGSRANVREILPKLPCQPVIDEVISHHKISERLMGGKRAG